MTTMTRQIVQRGIVTEDLGSTLTVTNHIDTYTVFELGDDSFVEGELSYLAEEYGNGNDLPDLQWGADYDVWYDHNGWLKDLAQASVFAIQGNLPNDSVIKAVEWTGKVWSPREYNFETDGYMARWTVDADALEQWLTDNEVVIEDGRGISGFIRTAKDDVWYLSHAIQEYLHAELFPGMWEYVGAVGENLGPESDFTGVYLTDAGKAKLVAGGFNVEDMGDGWFNRRLI